MSLTIAKTLGKAIAPLTGGISKELSGYLGDQIRFLRWKSAVHILKRARLFCDEEQISADKVPIKFLVPFLEGASFEDVDSSKSLSDMWSSLLGSAVTAYQARHAIYVDILKKISTKEAAYIRKFHSLLMKDEIYSDDGFDPDLWNANDKQDQTEIFIKSFSERGKQILDYYREEGFPFPAPFDDLMNQCVSHCIRTDVIPLSFDLSLYQPEGWTNGVSSPFKKAEDNIEVVFNLVALGLMEKFDVVTWYPKPHKKGSWAVRATCSFAVLTSLGFDFMKACLREPQRSSTVKGTGKASRSKSK